MEHKPNLTIFSSGTAEGGGSGFRELANHAKDGSLRATIVAVVSNHEHGGVRKYAEEFGIPFIHFPKPWTAEMYQKIVAETKAEFVALSGWLKFVAGLDPRTTFNIHPGPLPTFGGKGMYGIHVHEKVMEAYHLGEVTHSAATMHFVPDGEYDSGPVCYSHEVEIFPTFTPEILAHKVNKVEHEDQWRITDKIVQGEISWDGKDPNSLKGGVFIRD